MQDGQNRKKLFRFVSILLALIIIIPGSFMIYQRIKNYNLPDYDHVVRFDPHREGGHLLPDLNVYLRGERLNAPVKFITNSKGFRNKREFDYAENPEKLRILFLGDSFVDGIRTDQQKTIGYVLEEYVDANLQGGTYDDCEVMISGHNNPANAFYYYQEHGRKFHPDLVILGVTLGNDITWHNFKTGILPVRDADDVLYVTLASDVRQTGSVHMDLQLPHDAYVWEADPLESFQNLELRVRTKLSRIYALGYNLPPALGPRHNSRRNIYAAGFFVSLGLFYSPLMPEIEEMFLDFEEVLAGLKRRVEKERSQFLAVLFPVRIQVSENEWKLLKKYYSLDESKFDLSYPNRRIMMYCEKQGIDCFDLMPAFKQDMLMYDRPLYRSRGDMHFNERGQDLAGRIIGEKVATLMAESN